MGATLAAIDGTPGQVVADALLVVAAVVNGYLGWRYGLLRRLLALGGVYLGCFAATNLGNAITGIVHARSVFANAWSFIVVFWFVVIVVEVMGALLNDKVQKLAVAAFDRIGGIVVGALIGVVQVLVMFLVALAVGSAPSGGGSSQAGRATAATDIKAAALSGRAVRFEPQIRVVFGPVLPGDLAAHLGQSTQVLTPPV